MRTNLSNGMVALIDKEDFDKALESFGKFARFNNV